MNREDKIKKLYSETYRFIDVESIELEDMIDDLEQYYLAAGFDIKSIDDLLVNTAASKELIDEMQNRLSKISKVGEEKDINTDGEIPF